MTSSNKILKHFDQTRYNNAFYCCDNDHAFIAFVTVFCPLCDTLKDLEEARKDYSENVKELFEYEEKYYGLVHKVRETNPELLV